MRGLGVTGPDQEFQKLKAIHPSAELHQEGGKAAILLPAFAFTAGDKARRMTALLFPHAHSGYDSRLFFEAQIAGVGQNWTQHTVLGRSWWTPSWNGVPATMPWTQMLCAHLRGIA